MPLLPLLTLLACRSAPSFEPPVITVATADPERVRFVALGDTGKGNASQRRVARAIGEVCAERGCDLVLLLGDNYYPRGMQAPDDPRIDELVTDVYGSLDLPVMAVLGNHDWGHGRDDRAAEWQVAWARRHPFVQMPERYYSFQAAHATFFALDTTPVFWGEDRAQTRWLRDAIRRSETPWTIVLGHHTFRSNGEHGNAGAYEGLRFVPVVRGSPLRRLFEENVCGRADLYLAGHDHLLQWIEHCGTDLVVSGAGATARELVDRGNDPRFAVSKTGFAWIELGDTLRIAFYDEAGEHLYEKESRMRRSRGVSSEVP